MPAEYALSNVWIGLGVVIILFAIFYAVGYFSGRKPRRTKIFMRPGFPSVR